MHDILMDQLKLKKKTARGQMSCNKFCPEVAAAIQTTNLTT